MIHHFFIKIVRWTGWLQLPVLVVFFLSGYAMSDRFGLGVLASEQAALAVHRAMHVPMLALLVAHVIPSVYLSMLRNGWMKSRRS